MHRNTIRAWSQLPDAPQPTVDGTYPVAEWLKFAQSAAKRAAIGETDDKKALEIKLLVEKLRGQILTNDKQEGLLIPIDSMRETITACVAELRGHIRYIKDALPQALDGLDIPGRRDVINKFFDEMEVKIHTGRLSSINK